MRRGQMSYISTDLGIVVFHGFVGRSSRIAVTVACVSGYHSLIETDHKQELASVRSYK